MAPPWLVAHGPGPALTTMRYHHESQYPHIDINRNELAGMKLEPEELVYFRMKGSVGRYMYTPVFVDRCPDGVEPLQSITPCLDDEIIDAEIIE